MARLRRLRVRHCRLADQDHAALRRSYAHVGHRPNTICVAHAYWGLPYSYQLGIFWHEVGHLLLSRRPVHSEAQADQEVLKQLGIRVRYRDGPHGEGLQWVPPPWKRYWRAAGELLGPALASVPALKVLRRARKKR